MNLIEGFRPGDLPGALGPELEAEVMNGRPLVARVGTAEVLISLARSGGVFRAELAHVDGAHEGGVVPDTGRSDGRGLVEWLEASPTVVRPCCVGSIGRGCIRARWKALRCP
jgi:hypothetical protein